MSDGRTESPPIIEWSEALSIGNAAIDNDHKAFIELARLLRGLEKDNDSYAIIVESMLLMLEEYIAGHFLREEKAMKAVNFRHFPQHHHDHNTFRNNIAGIIKSYRDGVQSAIDNLHDTLTSWLMDHISYEDMKLKPCLQDYAVDNRPLVFLAMEAQEDREPVKKAVPPSGNKKLSLQIDFSKVRALICEPSGIIRSAIRLALNELGVCNIDEASTFVAIDKACEEGGHQLLILNQEIEGNDATYFIRQLRSLNTDRDPFVVTVLLLTSRDEDTVRAAMNSGSDSLLLIPFSTGQLKDQIKGQAERRKPFVVTQEYIGAERRIQPRPGSNSAPQIPVPNPVQAWGLSVPPDQYEQMKTQAIQSIAVARIKSLAGAIEYECNALTVAIRDSAASNESSFRSLAKLESVTEELRDKANRFLGNPPDGVAAFRARCQELKAHPGKLTFGDIEALSQAGREITSHYIAR